MFDLGDIVTSPDLAQPFTIFRSTGGKFLAGNWTSQTQQIDYFGTVSVASSRDIEMIPEGDRVREVMAFWSDEPIYGTGSATSGRSSDIIVWQGNQYRVLAVFRYLDYGYYKALATRMKAD